MKRLIMPVVLTLLVIAFIMHAIVKLEWREPTGLQGDVRVHYKIPLQEEGVPNSYVGTSFPVAGHIKRVQMIPISYHNEYGFVALYIQTTAGWYESPRCSLSAPVDWERGVEVSFEYPETMPPFNEKTGLSVRGFYPSFGSPYLRWRAGGFGFGRPVGEGGPISHILFRIADDTEVKVQRLNDLDFSPSSGGAQHGVAVDILVTEEEK